MKATKLLLLTAIALLFGESVFSQNDLKSIFRMTGLREVSVPVNKTINASTDVAGIDSRTGAIYGLSFSADVTFGSEDAWIRVILTGSDFKEYLVYETYPLLAGTATSTIDGLSEETGRLDAVRPYNLRVEVKDATVNVKKISYTTVPEPAPVNLKAAEATAAAQDTYKIDRINQTIAEKGLNWKAGNTSVSALSFDERNRLYGEGTFPAGFEYYSGGILEAGRSLKGSMVTSPMADQWDWRNRHGKNWVSPVKNQASCGSCWAFAATGAMEAQVNVFYNQAGTNVDLAEQELLSCSGAGSCTGGYPSVAISYIVSTGIIDEAAFPYSATDQLCKNKSATPAQQFKIAGRADFGSAAWTATEDNLKKMIIKYGPISGGLYNWSHAMTLVGWQVVKAGDSFFYRDLAGTLSTLTVADGNALIGKTVWIFKNSWGAWGDGGYVYVETDIANVGWTHALVSPVTSIKQAFTVACTDADGDGYYWWGVGAKPANCPVCPVLPDGDDSNAALGPLDEFGICQPVVAPVAPVADFAADKVSVTGGSVVTYTDLSTGEPTTWSWSFPGGTPSVSTAKNPVITYNSAGIYDVSLTVTNSTLQTNTLVKTGYVTVIAVTPKYCDSKGLVTSEWIASVTVGKVRVTSGSSGTAGYQYFPAPGWTVKRGTAFTLAIAPGYKGKAVSEYVSVWIDLNQDMDFDDAGERIVSLSGVRASVSKSITIPTSALLGSTRMRVSLKRSAAPGACETFTNGEVEDYVLNIGLKAGNMDDIAGVSASVKLYPNPCSQVLSVEVDEVRDQSKLAIYDMNGRMLSMQVVRDIVTRVDVSTLSAGIYVIMVQNGDTLHRERFIKD
jgi:PKD repeat protein